MLPHDVARWLEPTAEVLLDDVAAGNMRENVQFWAALKQARRRGKSDAKAGVFLTLLIYYNR